MRVDVVRQREMAAAVRSCRICMNGLPGGFEIAYRLWASGGILELQDGTIPVLRKGVWAG